VLWLWASWRRNKKNKTAQLKHAGGGACTVERFCSSRGRGFETNQALRPECTMHRMAQTDQHSYAAIAEKIAATQRMLDK
jgi:hypothetical protein